MGSTGSSRFTDYPRPEPAETGSETGAEREGGSGEDELCLTRIDDVALEEVERCAYYLKNTDVPPAGTDIEVLDQLVGQRLGVATQADSELIGYLPTRFNYVLRCLRQGYKFPGEVTASSSKPVAVVHITLEPTV